MRHPDPELDTWRGSDAIPVAIPMSPTPPPNPGGKRSNIRPGMTVRVVQKQHQRTGQLTTGVVVRILTSSPTHPHGIKVQLEGGIVGRVKEIVTNNSA